MPRRKVDQSIRCHKCGGRGYFKFRKKWWCEACLDKHENVDDPEYLEHERFRAYTCTPPAYDPTLEAPGSCRLTLAEKLRLVGI